VAKAGVALRNPENKRADVFFIPQPHPGAIGLELDCIATRGRSISWQTLHLIVCYAALYTIQWLTMDILAACVMVSVFTMIPVTLLSWQRLKAQET
jgi:Flp pilus assembly protein TadB